MVDRILNWAVWGTVSWIEFYWCLLMFAGFCLALYNVWDAMRDEKALRKANRNGIGELTVHTSIRGDILRAIELLAGLSIGIFGAFAPPSPLAPTSTFYWWYRLISIVAFLVIGNCIVINTVIIQHHRRKVLVMYDTILQH